MEDKAFLWLIVLASAGFLWIIIPFYGAILWAVVIALLFLVQPSFFDRLAGESPASVMDG